MKRNTILIIEDNEINREILAEILADDYRLLMAENGQKGLEQMRMHADELDVVLLDIQMPVMNGYQVLEAVSHEPQLEPIPIIVTTSNEGLDEEERCLKLKATDFIKKPYNPAIVRLRIESLIRMRNFANTLSEVEIDKRTGVYTRNAFIHYGQQWISSQPETDFTLSMSDIRGFKRLYETSGEQVFDLLRRQITMMKELPFEQLLVGVYNVDQLIFLHPTLHSELTDEEKQQWYEEEVKHRAKVMNVVVKTGICEHIDTSVPLTTHIDNVHAALREAKGQYNRYSQFFGKSLQDKMQRNARIEELMEEALQGGQMQVFYQPKHDAKTEQLVGAEALLRWISPELGFISPGEFIPIFERNGFVSYADIFVWRETCRNQCRWMDAGLQVVPISVNASRQDFSYADVISYIMEPLQANNVKGELMRIEITESLFQDLTDKAVSVLQHFRGEGIGVELDDFGTGYSSLNSLSDLPIDVVKFDMSFVQKLKDQRKQVVMRGCVDMIKHLNLHSIAEGVEDAETRQLIADMGIDAIQGYYYSKPLPAAEFEAYLAKYSKKQ